MRKHLALMLLLVAFLAVAVCYGLLHPLGESPDESAHLDLIRFIAQHGHMPRDYDERALAGYKSDTPMLYHLLIGSALRWVDFAALPNLRENSTNPRRLLIADGLSPFAVIHTEDEAYPYRGIVLAGHLARLASTLFSVGTVGVVYLAALAALSQQQGVASRLEPRWWALGAASLVAANPQFTFIAASVNDDSLLGLLCALFALCLVRAWREPAPRRYYAWAGVCLGLALTTKYSVALLPLVMVALLVPVVRRRFAESSFPPGVLTRRAAWGRLGIFTATFVAAAAWWFVFVVWHFNQVQELGWVTGLVKPFVAGGRADASLQQVAAFITGGALPVAASMGHPAAGWLDWFANLFVSFWLPGSPLAQPVGIALCVVPIAVTTLALAGLVQRRRPIPGSLIALLALQMLLLLPFPLLRFWLTGNLAETAQGRHILFPAAVPVGLLLMAGLASWHAREPHEPRERHAGSVPSARQWLIGLLPAGALLAVNLTGFFGLILPAFPAALSVRTAVDATEEVTEAVPLRFGDAVELVGYHVGTLSQAGALPVTLTWRSLGDSSRDLMTDVLLLDDADVVQARWLGQPVDGRYPTRAWEPGDVVRDTLWLLVAGRPAGEYRLCLRLLPVAMAGEPEASAGDCQILAYVTLPEVPAAPGRQRLDLPDGTAVSLDVWQSGRADVAWPIYRYRSTIQVSRAALPPDAASAPPVTLSLVGPDDSEHTPSVQTGGTYTFLVDAHWPTGQYRLRVRAGDQRVDGAPALEVRVRPRTLEVPPISHPANADFGGEVALLGFDFPERRAQPGAALPITLYWRAERDVQSHYIVFNHLLGADLRQWGGRDRIPRDYYSTALWTNGEVVRDDYTVPVDPAAPPGIYRLDVGLYELRDGLVYPVWLAANGQALATNSVTIAAIKVGGAPPGVTITDPAPAHSRADNLGDLVTLVGYDLAVQAEAMTVTLYWRCDARLPADYTTFVHLIASPTPPGQPGAVPAAQMDRPPADGAYPTSLWDAGEVIRDTVVVPLPRDLPAGDYQVTAGLYDATTGLRLTVSGGTGADQAPAEGAVPLTTIHLVADDSANGDGH